MRCGMEHQCAENMVDSRCPLERLDDGEMCCVITGLCIPSVRYIHNEYIDHAGPETCQSHSALAFSENLHEEVQSTVNWFLTGKKAQQS